MNKVRIMELELDLKLSKTKDDLLMGKDGASPIFLSRETETMFVLTAHLEGYTKESIKIDINEDGTLISISGNKEVMQKEESNMKGFMKVYKIPSGVALDEIKADYNDDESTLTIYMPKQKKGITGGEIEQVVKKHDKQKQFISDEVSDQEEFMSDNDQQQDVMHNEIEELVSKLGGNDSDEEAMSSSSKKLKKNDDASEDEATPSSSSSSSSSSLQERKGKEVEEIVEEKINDRRDSCDARDEKQTCDAEQGEKKEKDNGKCILFAPCFFIGSTLVASLVALLLNLVKPKRQ